MLETPMPENCRLSADGCFSKRTHFDKYGKTRQKPEGLKKR
jgi:hypothetical protein